MIGILSLLAAAFAAPLGGAMLFVLFCRCYHFRRIRRRQEIVLASSPSSSKNETIIAFFHPHCSAGGGGERVLWKAVQALGEIREAHGPLFRVAVYTTDEPSASYERDLFRHVKDRFSIAISPELPIAFVHLHKEAGTAQPRRLSMIAESAGTVHLAWRAMQKLTPHIFFDTTGCAFTFVVAKLLAGCKVVAYVHYPTISTDMLSLVWERRPTYNNNSSIARSSFSTYIKLVYYATFAFCYGAVGSLANLVMVNSSWTYGHIRYLWRFAPVIQTVFPPCDTKSLEDLDLKNRENIVLSIGQFRPEKDHTLQLRSFALFLEKHSEMRRGGVKLALVGSCRGEGDEWRVKKLRELAASLGVSDSVEFVLNQPYPVLKKYLGRASVGIHTMWNEHFGIGVVEMMAAGLITIAHNSGGPKADIVVPLDGGQQTGFLATTEGEYADAMHAALREGARSAANMEIRQNARKAARKFSDDVFVESFKAAITSSKILS